MPKIRPFSNVVMWKIKKTVLVKNGKSNLYD